MAGDLMETSYRGNHSGACGSKVKIITIIIGTIAIAALITTITLSSITVNKVYDIEEKVKTIIELVTPKEEIPETLSTTRVRYARQR